MGLTRQHKLDELHRQYKAAAKLIRISTGGTALRRNAEADLKQIEQQIRALFRGRAK